MASLPGRACDTVEISNVTARPAQARASRVGVTKFVVYIGEASGIDQLDIVIIGGGEASRGERSRSRGNRMAKASSLSALSKWLVGEI